MQQWLQLRVGRILLPLNFHANEVLLLSGGVLLLVIVILLFHPQRMPQ